MTAKQKPVIVLNRAVADVPSVVTDNPRGVRRAAEHLGELMHESITYVAGPEASWADGMRWRSLLEASMELHLKVHRIGPFPPSRTELSRPGRWVSGTRFYPQFRGRGSHRLTLPVPRA
jgi:LacI family transcriptional regulator